jgi:hypothetical protein
MTKEVLSVDGHIKNSYRIEAGQEKRGVDSLTRRFSNFLEEGGLQLVKRNRTRNYDE